MATRLVLNRARPFCNQLKGKLGFLGGISSYYSIVGRDYCLINPLPSSNYDCRRHYFLPPPPSRRVVDFGNTGAIHPVDDAEINTAVIKAAEFAVRVQNEASSPAQHRDNIIQFARVVRASRRCGVLGFSYFITLEALRGKADMNVYYAEVVERKGPLQSQMELIKWELVNESFSYPFQEILQNEYFVKKRRREISAAKIPPMGTWLDEMEKQCRGAEKCISPKEKIDHNVLVSQAFGNLNAEIFSSTPLKIDQRPTVALQKVFDIKTREMVDEYAMFAMKTHFKNEDEQQVQHHLKQVLWADKCKVNDSWMYRLLYSTTGENEYNYYYAIVKACPEKPLELIKCCLIPRKVRGPYFEEKGEMVSFLPPRQPPVPSPVSTDKLIPA